MGWITPADLAEALGPAANAADPYLVRCADAANDYAANRRREAGYSDDADVAPNAAVFLGTVRAGTAFYAERGSADGFASFDETAGFALTGVWRSVNKLLGVGRGQVDTPASETLAVTPLRRAWWPR